MQQIGLMNDANRFAQVAQDRLDDIVAVNSERNTDFMKLYFDNAEFQAAFRKEATRRAYKIITDPSRDEALRKLREQMRGHPAMSGAATTSPESRVGIEDAS